MNYVLLVFIFVQGFLVGSAIVLSRRTRRDLKVIQVAVTEMAVAGARLHQLAHALASRINPHGHVDLSPEEWKAAEGRPLSVIENEDGVRVLAK